MNPIDATEVLACENELGPVTTSFIVPFVCCRGSEAQPETDDETQHSQQDAVNSNYRPGKSNILAPVLIVVLDKVDLDKVDLDLPFATLS